jgi:hypothetical protein
MALPRKKLKNRGEAEGNNRQSTIQPIISKASFSPDVMLFLFVDFITVLLMSLGIKSLTRKG